MSELAIAIIIAVIELVVGSAATYGITESQTQAAEGRQSRETFVRHMYQAIKNRFGITIDQLNQASEKLGLKLSQLTESTRGSARLARATKIYRDFIAEYPEMVNKINNAKNVIQNEINNLDAKENAAASKIEKRGQVSNQEILKDAVGSISEVNKALNDSGQGGQIDTSLIDEDLKNDKTERSNSIDSSTNNSQHTQMAEWAKAHPGEDPRRMGVHSGVSNPRNPANYGIH